ncbi:MAG: DUF2235 domain-containing protein [Rhodanobacteraceae bacterium]|nr:MAG: DUF2235 domain-containing protein [Rhodanobacteraceae bacterium]
MAAAVGDGVPDAASSRKLVVLLDGTWSRAATDTNVERLYRLIAPRSAAGARQLCAYLPGVGVKPGLAHLLGGAFGLGLADLVKQGYRWLASNWQPGDEVWLFGFSRGAYAVRSLSGLVHHCGLLKRDAGGQVTRKMVAAAYKFYQRNLAYADPQAVAFRAQHSIAIPIHFIGVWETVGALGIPAVGAWFPYARKRYAFHDTALSANVRNACQALALDEHRAAFKPTRWTRVPPGDATLRVEQRWFVGAHSDVGGGELTDGAGHRPDTLSDITLAWMQAKAVATGLAFTTAFVPAPGAELDTPNPSWKTFMYGLYKLFSPRFDRVLGGGVNETIDPSVWMKWYTTPGYRPASLQVALDAGLIENGSGSVA